MRIIGCRVASSTRIAALADDGRANPAWFMGPGDVVSVEIEGIGVVTNPIVSRSVAEQQVQRS